MHDLNKIFWTVLEGIWKYAIANLHYCFNIHQYRPVQMIKLQSVRCTSKCAINFSR